eukprot:evm.model.scf_143.7 EVM.evm.TU.scf_143.7   scf_143:126222-136694(+)
MAAGAGEGSAMDQTSTRRLMLTVQDVVGKGSDGPPFWSPQFTKGFVEVKFGKMRTEKVSTAAQDMEDFELSFNEELAVDMDANCQELVVSVVSGEVDNPGPVLARCGIYLDQIVGTDPVTKYFKMYKMAPDGNHDKGGYIRVTVCWEPQDDEGEGSLAGSESLSVALTGPDIDGASLVVMEDIDSRSSISEEDVTPSWLSVPVVYRGPMPSMGSDGDLQWGHWAVAGSDDTANLHRSSCGSRPYPPPTPTHPSTDSHHDCPSDADRHLDLRSSGERTGRTSRSERTVSLDVSRDSPQPASGTSGESPQPHSQDLQLESLGGSFSSGAGMPRVNLTVVPAERGGQVVGGRGIGSGGQGAKVAQNSDLVESLSALSVQQRQLAGQELLHDAHPQSRGSSPAPSECAPSEAPTEYCVVAQCRGGVSPWLLFTLTAVGGAAAVALKVLTPGVSRRHRDSRNSSDLGSEPQSPSKEAAAEDAER